MVNDKMKRAGKAYATYAVGGPQSIINAAWTAFDPDGEAQPEINKDYLIICEYEDSVVRMKTARFDNEGWWRGNGVGLVKHITHYADPNDLLYVPEEK